MAILVKVEQHGDDLAIVLPNEVLAYLKAKLGDTLEVERTLEGFLIKTYDTQFEAKMASIRHVMEEHKDVLSRLAE